MDGRIYLDFWPDVKGSGRLLWGDRGAKFRDEEHAQWVGEEIHKLEHGGQVPLVDAIGAFRSAKSRPNLVSAKLEKYGERLRADTDLQPNTLEGYEAILRNHVSFWNGKIMRDITFDNLEAWRDELRTGLGDKSIRNIMTLFKGFIREYRRRDPKFVVPEFPKLRVLKNKQSRMPLNSLALVLDAIPTEDKGLFLCLVYTTIRPSEGRAQCNRHYNWKTGILDVSEALKTSSGADPEFGPTKTGEDGKYPLPDDLRKWLIEHSSFAARRDPDAPLFPNPRTGKLYKRAVPTDIWRKACKKAEVEYVPLYPATKHSGLTALSEAGVSIEDIQALARHKSQEMTRQYVVDDDKKRARAATALQRMIHDEQES